jgi:hypothetical protein
MLKLEDYRGTLPYASELFGIYQPLLGWKSRIIGARYAKARSTLYATLAARTLPLARTDVSVQATANALSANAFRSGLKVSGLRPVDLTVSAETYVASTIDSGLARLVKQQLPPEPPKDWRTIVDEDKIPARLAQLQKLLATPDARAKSPDIDAFATAFAATFPPRTPPEEITKAFFENEVKVAGYLVFLAQHNQPLLTESFYRPARAGLASLARMQDPLLNFGPEPYDAILSPVGIIHLYREYFFELDSFLGPPVGHVWLSPGGTVELVEVSTRKTVVDKSVEQELQTTSRVETTTTTQDEIADAVKEDNRTDTKFGFTNQASYSSPVFSDTATASFSLDNAKQSSRETTHKHMRQQSEKLSSEIKRNFRTSFRTTTETTDTSSKRYVLQNTTTSLVNYELRRKMRKVAVQVQDVGVQLCWHTFVDDAARELGVAKLVHIGQPPELSDLVQPDQPEIPQATIQELTINIPFVGVDTDDTDNAYTDGTETEVGVFDSTEHIVADFPQQVTFTTPGFTLSRVDLDPQGNDAKLSARSISAPDGGSSGAFTVHLDYVAWHNANSLNIKATLIWEPSQKLRDDVAAEYNKRIGDYNAEKARRFREAFYQAARERIKLASGIVPRKSEDLREEERVVVYRRLIGQLMSVGTQDSRHVTSELVRSIFDVDKMLYFVAPEWWAPRLHRSVQQLGEEPAGTGFEVMRASRSVLGSFGAGFSMGIGQVSRPATIPSENVVDWGGSKELGRDNYYITEESRPAKLGSSLGWLLQLDGDDLRNAMLNSPWVKAVIPIRPGREQAAISWLQQAHVEGSDGLDAQYVATDTDPPELKSTPGHTVTIRAALDFLIDRIAAFDRNTRTPIVGDPAEPDAPSNHFAGSLPTEAVFEHGFYPLAGGVRFDQDGDGQPIFSQWLEIMPTDQVAALQVEYDPKTLQVKTPD